MPLPLKIVVDSVLGNQPLPRWLSRLIPSTLSHTGFLLFAAGLLILIALLSNLQSLASWLLQTYTGEKLVHDLRAQLLWHVQRLSLSFHERRGANDTAYRIQYDAAAIQNILIHGLLPIVSSAFAFVAMLYVTAQINWRLAIVAIITFLRCFGCWPTTPAARSTTATMKSASLTVGDAHFARDSCRGSRGQGVWPRKPRRRTLPPQIAPAHDRTDSPGIHSGQLSVLIGFAIALGTAAALVVGVRQVQAHAITVGELLLVMA